DDLANNLFVFGNGTGNGGSVTFNTRSDVPFRIDPSTTEGVRGSLIARAGLLGGDGGTVSITNNGTGGIQIDDTSRIEVRAVLNGNGGNITLNAANGQLTIDAISGGFNVDGLGAGNNQGGTITLTSGFGMQILNGPLALSANGSDTGNGGTITINNQGDAPGVFGQVHVRNANDSFQIFGTSGASGGNGGIVNLSTGGNMEIDTAGGSIDASPQSAGGGNGAQCTFTAGTARPGNVQITGDLNASASGGAVFAQ